jgi:hypothetical protein
MILVVILLLAKVIHVSSETIEAFAKGMLELDHAVQKMTV